ncbi:MAG: efflux RND transporter permease subunit [Armatimonadota bacterium]
MWLTNVSIKRPVFILMVVLALIVLGFTARQKMPEELTPKVDLPYITVSTIYAGAGPQEIETLVTKPVEDAVGSTSGLKNITSYSQDGISVVVLEFELGTNSDTAAADVRDKLSAIRSTLPDDIEEPSVTKVDIGAQPIITMALRSSNMSGRDLRILADKTIREKLSSVRGAAAVYVEGGEEREVAVSIDRDRLQAYGLSINQVAQEMAAENLNLPSGSIKEGSGGKEMRSYAVRTVGEFKDANEIANIKLQVPGGGTVRLGDIATVQDTVKEPEQLVRLNGKSAVIISVQKQSDANTVEVADGVKKDIDFFNGYKDKQGNQVKGQLPAGTKLIITNDDSQYVKDSLHDVNESLLEGIILVILIVFLFLHSGRATMIVAIAIPTSLVATFLPISSFGFTMNMMTMLALSLCVGILVDDSIVVLENIERHVRKGEAPPEAALNGRSEIGLAAIAITLVDVVVFVPIAFMGGIVGQFFRQFGITIATATLFSLFMSFTLTPMLASRWLRSKEDEEATEERAHHTRTGHIFDKVEAFYSKLDKGYRGVLSWALENRAMVVAIGIISLFTVLAMMPVPTKFRIIVAVIAAAVPLLIAAFNPKVKSVALIFGATMVFLALFVHFPIGGEFMPETDQGKVQVSVELPAGSGLDATDKVVRQIENILAHKKGVQYYQSSIGSSSSGHFSTSSGSQYATINVKLLDKGKERPMSQDEFITQLSQDTALIPGATIRVSSEGQMGPSGQPIQMEISGSNMDEMVMVADQVQAKMAKVPGVINIKNSWELGKPELQITVDRLRAADHGMSVAQVASAVRTSIVGNTNAKLRDQGDEYDIRVQLAKPERESVEDVSNVIVGSQGGAPVYLRDVADVKLSAAPNKIDRKNRQRLITVGANIDTGAGYKLANVQNQINKALKNVQTGSTMIKVGGSSEMMNESFGYMISALFLAIALVYMLMGALFESFITPLVIMFSLPQAMIGALLALMITGYTISIVTMIGIIMLVGLVTKNAILLIDYTNTLRERGLSRNEAVLEAGPTRLRPIMMTTLAMVGGMMPTALALAKGSEWRAPMAVAVIGGLILSTLLTLLVIPTTYTIVDDWWNAFRRKLGHKEDPNTPDSDPKMEIEPEYAVVDGDGHVP